MSSALNLTCQGLELVTAFGLSTDVKVVIRRQFLRRRRNRLPETPVPEGPTLHRRRVDGRPEVVAVEGIEDLVVAETL